VSARSGGWSAYRHVFTSAPENFPEGGGFRTVAYAAALRGEKVSLIESLVESYTSWEGGGARCRQFVPLARGAKACALTVFTPLADSPDGRTGNFWAETQVVPSKWLEQAGWDAAAAFDALSWWGPRNLGDLPQNLEPEPLASLEPGSVERLARLNKFVPSECLEPLLHAVVQQSRGLRPLELLEAQGTPTSQLEEVVMLVPLTVPPRSRRYLDADQLRCLSLRTRCPIGGMTFRTDVTGYPAAAADGLELSDGFVIDLADRLPTKSHEDRFGRDYVEWLLRVIQDGEWNQLEALYKRAVDCPGASFFPNYRSLLQAPSRPRVTIPAEVPKPVAVPERAEKPNVVESSEATAAPPAAAAGEPTAPLPLQPRKQAWAVRDETEGAIWQVLESHKSQLEELVGQVRQDFSAELDKVRDRLMKEVADRQKGLDATLKEFEKEVKKVDRKAGKYWQQQSASLGRESSTIEARLEKLERDIARIAERPARAGVSSVGRGARTQRSLSLDWLRDHRWIAWMAGIGLLLALLGVIALRATGNIPSTWFTPPAQSRNPR